jgi:hypothetical protein
MKYGRVSYIERHLGGGLAKRLVMGKLLAKNS